MDRIRNILGLVLICSTFAVQAQNKVSFNGAGRMLIDHGEIGGDLIDTDSTTSRKEMRGLALFDLGINIRPNEVTEIRAVTRVENDIDGFWGAGIQFQLRELYAAGVAADVVKYRVGDIDAALTPYTLYNDATEFRLANTQAFDVFRDITDYENFYSDSSWRQQGVEAEWRLDFSRGIDALNFRGLLSKNRQTDFFFTPDRLLGLVQVGVLKNDWRLDLNFIDLFEVSEASQFNDAETEHQVWTARLTGLMSQEKIDWTFAGESGFSRVMYDQVPESPAESTEDFFVDATANAYFKESGLHVSLKIADVGPDFRSPGAQSRRVNVNAEGQAFSNYTNREIQRPLNLADVILDPTVYERTITPALQDFNPAWENALPYGQATPNRRQIAASVKWDGDSAKRIQAGMDLAYLTEIRGEGTEELRNFLHARIHSEFHFANFLGWEKHLDLNVAARYQKTSRNGDPGISEVDLTSTILELGFDWEVYKRVDVLVGYAALFASGNEFVALRDGFNQLDFYETFDGNMNQSLLNAGLRYRFNSDIDLSLQYQNVTTTQDAFPLRDYNISHILLLYNMFF
jgi:hypothetical protein